jgi:hypothetical protein
MERADLNSKKGLQPLFLGLTYFRLASSQPQSRNTVTLR